MIFHRSEVKASPWKWRTWRTDGRITELAPGVYLKGHGPAPWDQCVRAALMWAGPRSAACRKTAATLLGIGNFDRGVIQLGVPGSPKLPQALAFDLELDRDRAYGRWDVYERKGIRITRPERTLLDLGGDLEEGDFERLVGEAIRKRLTNAHRLRACLDRLEARGRRGVVALRKLFSRRGAKLLRIESDLERRYAELFARLTIPMPDAQYDFPHWGRPFYRLDFAYPEQQLGIEIDSHLHHSGRSDWAKDQTRTNELVSHGWSILHFTEADLSDPAYIEGTIQSSLWERGWR